LVGHVSHDALRWEALNCGATWIGWHSASVKPLMSLRAYTWTDVRTLALFSCGQNGSYVRKVTLMVVTIYMYNLHFRSRSSLL